MKLNISIMVAFILIFACVQKSRVDHFNTLSGSHYGYLETIWSAPDNHQPIEPLTTAESHLTFPILGAIRKGRSRE